MGLSSRALSLGAACRTDVSQRIEAYSVAAFQHAASTLRVVLQCGFNDGASFGMAVAESTYGYAKILLSLQFSCL
jgi:hypothetical protein